MSDDRSSDPMLKRLRKMAGNGYEWLHDVADRLEQLQMPRSEVLRIAQVSDEGADSAALMKALCQKVEAQRRRLAGLEQRVGAQGKTLAHCREVLETNDPGNARLIFGEPKL